MPIPGLLSTVFADQSGQSTDNSADADEDADLAYEATVGHDISVTYQEADGSTSTWESDTDVTVAMDVTATLDATTELGGTVVAG